jgi:hypothetical protein
MHVNSPGCHMTRNSSMWCSRIACFVFVCSVGFLGGNVALAEQNILGDCPPSAYSRQQLESIKADDFQPRDDTSDDVFATILADCLGSPDATLRDGIAYEGLVALLRAERVSDAGKRALLEKLSAALRPGVEDSAGFAQPFAALGLAEVARTDRIQPYLSQQERQELVQTGGDYLVSIDDYRGFHEDEGWRHGVAHTADLLMQLALNDNIGLSEHRAMLAAIASQIAPPGVFYQYGESARLARPVLYIATKGTIGEEEWSDWLAEIAAPHPLASWSDAFSSDAGLARRHNTSAFLRELYLNASLGQNESLKVLLPGTIAAITALP